MGALSLLRRRKVRIVLFAVAILLLTGGIASAVFLVQIILAGQALEAGDLPPAQAQRDITEAYNALTDTNGVLDSPRVEAAFAKVAPALMDTTVVIVPSYLVDQLALGRELGLIDYFSDQVAWLNSQSINTVFAPVDTEASVADNGAVLRDLIADSDDPLCFISHSKGGLDTLEGLLLSEPDARAKVRCWIAFQAPFSGTPLADVAAGFDLSRPLFDEALALLGGSGQSLDDLTTDVRKAYLSQHGAQIAALADDVPILAVSTRLLPSDALFPDTPFAVSRWWMAQSDIESDGAVPTSAAILPYARFITIDGLDHADTFDSTRLFGDEVHDDVLFLKAMFALVLDGAG